MRVKVIFRAMPVLLILLFVNLLTFETYAQSNSENEQKLEVKKFNLLVQFREKDGTTTEFNEVISENEAFHNSRKNSSNRTFVINGILLPSNDGYYNLYFSRTDIFEDSVKSISTGVLKLVLNVPHIRNYYNAPKRSCSVTIAEFKE